MKQGEADFPAFFGTYELIEDGETNAELQHIHDYIAMSSRVWPLIEADRYDAEAAKQEDPFMDLIESDQWSLVDRRGRRTPILVPVFATDGRIHWRLNPDA